MIFLNSASSAAALVFYLPIVSVHTLTPRENRERPESGIFLKILKKTQYLMNTLYIKAIIRRDLVSVSEFVFNDGKLGYRDASYPLL